MIWLGIKVKLAASGRTIYTAQLEWAINHGIRSVVTIGETPLEPK